MSTFLLQEATGFVSLLALVTVICRFMNMTAITLISTKELELYSEILQPGITLLLRLTLQTQQQLTG